MNGDWLVPRFEVDGVEEPNLVEAKDVPEIPTGDHIRVRHRRERDMKHVIAELGRQDAVSCVPVGKLDCLGGELNTDSDERDELGMELSDERRCASDLRRIPPWRECRRPQAATARWTYLSPIRFTKSANRGSPRNGAYPGSRCR